MINVEKTIRDAVRGIGYTNDDDVFHADRIFINNYLTTQSPDIAQGVDARKVEGKKTAEQGAGDQGIMFGYACDETPECMPAPIMFAHRLGRELTRIRKAGRLAPWLRPDAKSQVSVEYVDGKPTRIVNVVISTQHAADVSHGATHLERRTVVVVVARQDAAGLYLLRPRDDVASAPGVAVVGVDVDEVQALVGELVGRCP